MTINKNGKSYALQAVMVPGFAVRSIAESLACRVPEISDALSAAGLPEDLLSDPPEFVDVVSELELLEIGTGLTCDDLFAVRCGVEFQARRTTLTSYLLQNSDTIRQALANIVRFCRLTRPTASLAESEESFGHFLKVESSSELVRDHVPHTEFRMSAIVANFNALADTSPVRHIRFSHTRPSQLVSKMEAVLGRGIRMNCPVPGVVFRDDLLDEPIRIADRALLSHLQEHAENLLKNAPFTEGGVGVRVRSFLLDNIEAGRLSSEAAAKALGMSKSTLYRRLQEEGHRFGFILRDTRHCLADRYLCDTRLGLAEIALKLGYADQPAFSTAYRRWTGQSPARARRLHAAAAARPLGKVA